MESVQLNNGPNSPRDQLNEHSANEAYRLPAKNDPAPPPQGILQT